MNKRAIAVSTVLALFAAGVAGFWPTTQSTILAMPDPELSGIGAGTRPTGAEELHVVPDREWIVGTWQSYKLDYGNFAEWKGTAQIEVVASSADEINLWLISGTGTRSRAGDSQPSIMRKGTLFFGPLGSGLLFRYRRSGKTLILDLDASDHIHAELRRVHGK